MLDFQAARWLIEREVPKQAGNDHPTSIPTGVFKTADGHINIAAAGRRSGSGSATRSAPDDLHRRPGLRDRRSARSQNRDALNAEIDARHRQAHAAPTGSSVSTRPACRAGRSTRSTRCSRTRRCEHLGIAQPRAQKDGTATAHGRPAGVAVAHAEQARGAAAGARRAHRRGAAANSASAADEIAALRTRARADLMEHEELHEETAC